MISSVKKAAKYSPSASCGWLMTPTCPHSPPTTAGLPFLLMIHPPTRPMSSVVSSFFSKPCRNLLYCRLGVWMGGRGAHCFRSALVPRGVSFVWRLKLERHAREPFCNLSLFFLAFSVGANVSGAESEPPRGISLNSYSMWGYLWTWRLSPTNAARCSDAPNTEAQSIKRRAICWKCRFRAPSDEGVGPLSLFSFCFLVGWTHSCDVEPFRKPAAQTSLADAGVPLSTWRLGTDVLEHRVFVDVGQALLKREEGSWILHHRRQEGLVLSPEIRIAHGRMLLVLDGGQLNISRA